MGGGLESRCVCRVCGADGAVHGTIRTAHTNLSSISEHIVFQKLFKTYVTSHPITHLVLYLMCHCRSMPEDEELILPLKDGVVIIILSLIY